ATASGLGKITLIYSETYISQLLSYNIDEGCNSVLDIAQGVGGAKNLTAGMSQDGIVYFFYFHTTDPLTTYYARIVRDADKNLHVISQVFPTYSPLYLTTASFSTHFIPVVFTTDVGT